MDFAEIFNVLLDLPYINLLSLMGVEFLLCPDVTLSKNAVTCYNLLKPVITCFLESS